MSLLRRKPRAGVGSPSHDDVVGWALRVGARRSCGGTRSMAWTGDSSPWDVRGSLAHVTMLARGHPRRGRVGHPHRRTPPHRRRSQRRDLRVPGLRRGRPFGGRTPPRRAGRPGGESSTPVAPATTRSPSTCACTWRTPAWLGRTAAHPGRGPRRTVERHATTSSPRTRTSSRHRRSPWDTTWRRTPGGPSATPTASRTPAATSPSPRSGRPPRAGRRCRRPGSHRRRAGMELPLRQLPRRGRRATSPPEFGFCCAQAMVDLSRLAEELILWATTEFGWGDLRRRLDHRVVGASPQEEPGHRRAGRGRRRRHRGAHRPARPPEGPALAYNRDLQEDKVHVFALDDSLGGTRGADRPGRIG